MKKDPIILLEHILESIDDITFFLKSVTQEKFEKNKEKINAVVRSLEIVGEAAKNLPEEIKIKYKDVAWKGMIGTRDRIIHQYFGVKLNIIWKIVQEDLPTLKKQLIKIKEELRKDSGNK